MNTDSTYTFDWWIHMSFNYSAKGKWSVLKSKIILNPITVKNSSQYRVDTSSIKSRVIENFSKAQTKKLLEITIDDSIPDVSTNVYINEMETYLQPDSTGKLEYDRTIKSFLISSLAINDYSYRVKHKKSNIFICKLYHSMTAPFDNMFIPAKFKLMKNGNLIAYDENGYLLKKRALLKGPLPKEYQTLLID